MTALDALRAAHYPPDVFAAGEGVLLGSGRGVWIGRAKT